jgi:hypothetical protein
LVSALDSGVLKPSHAQSALFEPAEGIDGEAAVVVGRSGCECVFFEPGGGRLCAIHRDLGHSALPSACQHFPRVVAIDPRGVTLSLSHVCPTAGDLLFADEGAWNHFVGQGRVVIEGLEWSGLDARDALPPQVHGALLWDWGSMSVFDERALDVLARLSPERALGVIDAVATALARPGRRELGPRVSEAFAEAEPTASPIAPDVAALTDLAARCSSGGLPGANRQVPAAQDVTASGPAWERAAPHVCRYLAARLLASPVMYHALDVRVWSGWLQTCYSVLRSSFARARAREATSSSRAPLKAAAADADRLLVHRLDAGRLASALFARSAIRS